MNPIAALILVILVFVVLVASRRVALLGMMAGVLYLTEAQQVSVLGFNFFAMRFIELAGFIRVMSRREFSFHRLNKLDRAVIWLYVYTTVVFLMRSKDGVAFQIGAALDALLCYFTFRGLMSDVEEFKGFLRGFLILLTPFAALVLIESITRHNPFSILGGSVDYAWLREGRIRCQGSFRHPSLMGTLGAVFFSVICRAVFFECGTSPRGLGNRVLSDYCVGFRLRRAFERNCGGRRRLDILEDTDEDAPGEMGDCRIYRACCHDDESASLVSARPDEFGHGRRRLASCFFV